MFGLSVNQIFVTNLHATLYLCSNDVSLSSICAAIYPNNIIIASVS